MIRRIECVADRDAKRLIHVCIDGIRSPCGGFLAGELREPTRWEAENLRVCSVCRSVYDDWRENR